MTAGDGSSKQLDLGQITPEGKPSGAARKRAKKAVNQEARLLSRRARRLYDDMLEHTLESRRHDLNARKKYGPFLFKLVVAWLFLILATVWASGIEIEMPASWDGSWFHVYLPIIKKFKLSDAVLIALVSGATINVIGLLFAVVNYTFPGSRRTSSRRSLKSLRKKRGRD